MSHGDTVVNGDRIEFGGEASEFFNLLLHNLPDLMQMSVTRHKLRERVDHGNNRFAKLRFFHSIRTPELWRQPYVGRLYLRSFLIPCPLL